MIRSNTIIHGSFPIDRIFNLYDPVRTSQRSIAIKLVAPWPDLRRGGSQADQLKREMVPEFSRPDALRGDMLTINQGGMAEIAGLIKYRLEVALAVAERDTPLANWQTAIRLALDAATDREELPLLEPSEQLEASSRSRAETRRAKSIEFVEASLG